MENWQFTPYVILYIISVLLSFSLFIVVLRTRPVRGKIYFELMLLSVGIWTLGYMLGFFNSNFQFKLYMLRMEYIGIVATPFLWFFFVLAYTNNDKWLTLKTHFLFSLPAVFTYVQILFIQKHHFYYIKYDLKEFGNLIITDKIYGPGFYIWTSFSYLMVLSGIFMLARGIIKMPERFHGQIILHVFTVLVVLFPNVLYITGNNPIAPYDPICLSFVAMSIMFLYIIRYHRFFEIVPVAHHLVFKNVKSGVLVTDKDLKIMDVNPASEGIFGKSANALIGKSIWEISPMFTGIMDKIQSSNEFITEISTPDELNTFELQCTVLNNHKNLDLGRILMLYDITQRKQALKELNAYAHTVAHNLKNPMVSLCGFVDILLDGDTNPEDETEFLGYIGESAYKMHSIIDGLLLLSKIRNNDEIATQRLNMQDIINQVLSRLKHTISKYNGQITFDENMPDSLGYPLWVEEIWMNYITNALKYGGTPPVIHLGAEKRNGEVKYWVKDNGKGIKSDEQDNLFSEFTQLNNKKTMEGYGLGLSIVKRITVKLNGRVGVESSYGSGASFYFTLPG